MVCVWTCRLGFSTGLRFAKFQLMQLRAGCGCLLLTAVSCLCKLTGTESLKLPNELDSADGLLMLSDSACAADRLESSCGTKKELSCQKVPRQPA
jgi:hypothetical protein